MNGYLRWRIGSDKGRIGRIVPLDGGTKGLPGCARRYAQREIASRLARKRENVARPPPPPTSIDKQQGGGKGLHKLVMHGLCHKSTAQALQKPTKKICFPMKPPADEEANVFKRAHRWVAALHARNTFVTHQARKKSSKQKTRRCSTGCVANIRSFSVSLEA